MRGGFATQYDPASAPRPFLKSDEGEVDLGDTFGFSEGSSVQDPGEREVSLTTTMRSGGGAGFGHYAATEIQGGVEFGLTRNWQIGASATALRQSLTDGTDTTAAAGFEGGEVDVKYNFLKITEDRPFGVAAGLELGFGQIDPVSGLRQNSAGYALNLMGDARLLPDTLWLAANASISGATSVPTPGVWAQSEADFSLSLSAKATSRLYVGVEAQYSRAYGRLPFGSAAADRLAAGPHLYYKLNRSAYLSVAYLHAFAARTLRLSDDAAPFDRDIVSTKIGANF